MQTSKKTYWENIGIGFRTLSEGLGITFRHFFNSFINKKRSAIGPEDDNYFNHQEGIFTLEYPKESMPVPDNGRYRLHNEIDDCIVCDKCAKVCPVDCIDIESIRSKEEIRKTSDGSSVRLYASKFDIDMAKCCYCGLCTTVCPTECLTMTKTYDYSEYDIRNMTYSFSKMSPEEVKEKQKEYEEHQAARQKAKTSVSDKPKPKPSIKPKVSVPGKKAEGDQEIKPKKPVFKPKLKPSVKKSDKDPEEKPEAKKPRPVIKPKIKPSDKGEGKPEEGSEKKKAPKPKIVIKKSNISGKKKEGGENKDS